MNFYREGLDADQLSILQQSAAFLAEQGFYLAGGTALAIYYAHRRSADLDWFTIQPIDDPLQLAQSLKDAGLALTIDQIALGTLHARVGEVRASFFEFRYPLLQPVNRWQDTGCNLASLDDLACMKLSAIAQRGSKKDFFDLHALVTRHRPLAEVLSLYRQKFGVSDISSVLYGLAYFDDADDEPDPVLLWDIPWRTVKSSVSGWLKELSR
jgi:hypothetical protein